MASFGMDPASAAERLGHTDGGALFLRLYRHLYEGEKRVQAICTGLAYKIFGRGTDGERTRARGFPLNEGSGKMGAPGIEPGTSRV